MDTNNQTGAPAGGEKKQNTGTKVVIALLVIIILLLLGLGSCWVFQSREAQPTQTTSQPQFAGNASVGIMPGKTEEQILEGLQKKLDEKMVAFSINSVPVFPDGKSEGNLMLESPQSNINYIEFEIRRDDTGELIYKSGLLQPNQYIEKDKLQVELPKGSYPCTADIVLYKPETMEKLSKVQAGLTITVQN